MRRIAGALLVAASACGIDAVGSFEAPGPAPDGGPVEASLPPSDGSWTPPDADVDAGVDAPIDAADAAPDVAGCTVVIDDPLDALSSSWTLYGTALFSAGVVDITAGDFGEAGAMFWTTPITFGSVLHIEVDYAIVTAVGSTPGEGIAVTWLDTSTPYTLGSTGQGLALCGQSLNGTAVTLDSRDSQIIALSSIDMNCGTNGAVTSANVAAATSVAVEIRSGVIEGTLSTGQKSTRVRTNPTTGLFGITSSTGGSGVRSKHTISRVKVTSCP